MRILLINPWKGEYLPPPAIGYLQAVVKRFKIDVTACNYNEALMMNDDYDIIGASFHSFSVRYAKSIRDKFKGHLICGGHHPSALPDQMLAIGYDQVVIGEGERAIIDIINGNTSQKVYGKNIDIDSIPFPDYTGLPFGGEIGISIITSRGCPYACNFCASSDFWHHRYRMRSADNVLSEIEERKSEGYKYWIFEDDNFTLNLNRTLEICSQLDGQYLWQCTSRAEVLTKDLCKELYRAGCRKLWLGIETLSQESLERCNKQTTVDKMLTGIKNAYEAGIGAMSLFIIGLPRDTQKDIEITREKIRGSYITEIGVNIAWILPGTDIYRKAKEQGFDDNIYLESGAPYYTYEQSLEKLGEWEYLIMTAK
jgi:anaerobic magnesium-protoporphyrin IX monomethyl ester cyclase